MSESIRPGTLYIVSTPIGNLDDISTRATRILGGVDYIAAEDTRTTKTLLDHLSITKPLISYFSYNERKRVPLLLDKLSEGQSIAVVTDAGTPGISDPAHVVIREAVARGIDVVPIPGASALLAALVASGLPADRFIFEGFLPVKKGRRTRLEQLSREQRTIVLYESPHRILKTLEEILAHCGNRKVALARELTKKFEEVIRGDLTQVIEAVRKKAPRGEYALVLAGLAYRTEAAEPVTGGDQHG